MLWMIGTAGSGVGLGGTAAVVPPRTAMGAAITAMGADITEGVVVLGVTEEVIPRGVVAGLVEVAAVTLVVVAAMVEVDVDKQFQNQFLCSASHGL